MNFKKQKGAAAIYFVLVAVAILGMGALGVEGSRYITEKAHLGDVMEATAVAISESDDIRDDNKFGEEQQAKAKEVARAWVDYLMPDNIHSDFVIDRKKEVFTKVLPSGQEVKRTIHKYYISSTTEHISWMPMENVPSFDKTQKVTNRATAARVRTDFEPVDVVFVSDFSGSMKGGRISGLKSAIKDVTEMIFEGTQELKEKHKNDPITKINDSSFGFIPFSKRIVVKRGNEFYCGSMLRPRKNSKYQKPMEEQEFSKLGNMWSFDSEEWMKRKGYSPEQRKVMHQYISDASSKRGGWFTPLDCNLGDSANWRSCNASYSNHISYSRTATELQLNSNYKLSTPMKFGHYYYRVSDYCKAQQNGLPRFYNIDRLELKERTDVDSFNAKISNMTVGGGTDMYQGLLAAPGQFINAINKNRFIIVLSDGDENNNTFKNLVENKLCTNIRKNMRTNAKGEAIRFEMFVIGLQFKNNAQSYKDCFNKHIYTVDKLDDLKKVILELLTNTTSYNVERV